MHPVRAAGVLCLFGRLSRRGVDWRLAPPQTAVAGAGSAEKVELRLLTILELVNGWLQFAEAKNAGLVALDVFGLAAIVTILPSTEVAIADPVAAGMLAAGFLLLLSLGVSLWSFIPRGNGRKLLSATRRRPRASDNLYFYGDVRGYRPDQLAAAIARRYDKIADYDPAAYPSHVDLASQIITNSRITVAKNDNFRIATLFALLAFVAAAGGVIVELVGR